MQGGLPLGLSFREHEVGNLERNLEMREAPFVLISDSQYWCSLTYLVSSSKVLIEELWAALESLVFSNRSGFSW